MNRLALLLVFAATLPLTAHADDASKRAKAQEMVTLLRTDRMVQQVSANFMKQLSMAGEKLIGPSATPEKKNELSAFEKKFSDMIDAEVGWKVLEPAFVDIYSSTFTEDELTSIVTFYKSPAGITLVDKMPSVNTQATQILQTKLAALQPQMKQMYEEFQRSQVAPPPAAEPTRPAPSLTAPTTPPASTPK